MTIDTHQRKSMIKENICVFEVFPVCILFNMMLILHYLHKIWQFIYLHKRGGDFWKRACSQKTAGSIWSCRYYFPQSPSKPLAPIPPIPWNTIQTSQTLACTSCHSYTMFFGKWTVTWVPSSSDVVNLISPLWVRAMSNALCVPSPVPPSFPLVVGFKKILA